MSKQKQSRPVIPGIDNVPNKSDTELFQNKVLRPIIKMQYDLLTACFKSYLISKKIKFDELNAIKKIDCIGLAFSKDQIFKADIRGLIIGQFNLSEYGIYLNHKSEFNRRILNMIRQRIESIMHSI